MATGDLTVNQMLKQVREWDAGCMQIVGRREDGTPNFIVVCAVDERAVEVDDALKMLETKWESEEIDG